MNNGVHVYFQVVVFSGRMPMDGIARLYGSYIFSFLGTFTIFHSGCTDLHSP